MEGITDVRVSNLLRRHQIKTTDIKYMIHSKQCTVLYLMDGREITSSLPLKVIYANFSDREFWSIQKGVVVSVHHTTSIDENSIYTMDDGRQFKGRSRNPAEHKRRAKMLAASAKLGLLNAAHTPVTLMKQCAMMEKAPFAFFVIEVIFSENGYSIDFVFRYCNEYMEHLPGVPTGQMVGKSFYEVFPEGDKKWIVPYADVALNGTSRIIREYSTEIKQNLVIHCFQPKKGYCAGVLFIRNEV